MSYPVFEEAIPEPLSVRGATTPLAVDFAAHDLAAEVLLGDTRRESRRGAALQQLEAAELAQIDAGLGPSGLLPYARDAVNAGPE